MPSKLPKFFGIDIGKNTTKIAVVEGADTPKPTIKRAFSFDTGAGSLSSDSQEQRLDLAKHIKDAIVAAKLDTRQCIVALPEPSVFNRLLTFPTMPEEQLNEAIHWNATQFIPIPVDEVQMDWIKTAEVVVEGKPMIQLLLVAAPKKLINQTLEVFKAAELDLIAIETESVATGRIIAHNYPNAGALLVLDVGTAGTDLSVLNNGSLIFSQSLGTGSEAMTKAIASTFSLDVNQAEQYKLKFGMLPDQAEGKIYQTLQPVANVIITEVVKTINFFRSKYQQSTPQEILILGEGAKVPGISEYIKSKVSIPTSMANLAQNFTMDKSVETETASLSNYAVAIGLAMKTK